MAARSAAKSTAPAAKSPSAPSPEQAAAPAVESESPSPAPEPTPAPAPSARTEQYEAVKPDGTVLVVTRNIDTGEATYSPK